MQRDTDGKFIVSNPLKHENELGDSNKMAFARFLSKERKFQNNPVLKERYCEFMREYLELGTMIPSDNPNQFILYAASSSSKRNQFYNKATSGFRRFCKMGKV